MLNFDFQINESPFFIQKTAKTSNRFAYLLESIFIALFGIIISAQVIEATQKGILLLTDGKFAIFFKLIWYLAGTVFFVVTIYIALSYFLAFLQIDTKLTRSIAGTSFLIDAGGFHLKNIFNKQTKISYPLNSNYKLKAKNNSIGDFFIFELIEEGKNETDKDKLIFKDSIHIKFLKKINLDKYSFTESLKRCDFIEFQ